MLPRRESQKHRWRSLLVRTVFGNIGFTLRQTPPVEHKANRWNDNVCVHSNTRETRHSSATPALQRVFSHGFAQCNVDVFGTDLRSMWIFCPNAQSHSALLRTLTLPMVYTLLVRALALTTITLLFNTLLLGALWGGMAGPQRPAWVT